MNESKFENNLGLAALLLAVVSVLLVFFVLYLYTAQFGDGLSYRHERWAQFGDYIGGVLGTVFAFFALLALLVTLRLQSRELKNSSEELRNSALALKQQSESLLIQNFENRFFSMLSLHHQIVNAIDLRSSKVVSSIGRDSLKVIYSRLVDELAPVLSGNYLDARAGYQSCYDIFYEKHSHELGHYFRFIYRILKFVNDSDVPNKRDYTGVLRAQFSNPELALLYYNGLSNRGEKFKILAEKYSLFENIEKLTLVKLGKDVNNYELIVFGDQCGEFSDYY